MEGAGLATGILLAGLAALALCATAGAAEWQFAVDVGPKGQRAFMWIPPTCRRVRGVVIGQQVILEARALEDPRVRRAAAREDLAIIIVVPAAIGYDEFGPKGKGAETLQRILDRLAEASGYREVAHAPLLAIGHSGGAIFAWRLAYWKPGRCFGVVAIKSAPIGPPAHDPKATIDGVPLLDVSGQYESWGGDLPAEHHWRWVRGDLLALRARWRRALVSELVEPGVTHFGWDETLARHVAMFIEKAAGRRIPPGPPPDGRAPVLRDLDLESGWLTDCTLMAPSRYAPAPYLEYEGDPTLAFWHLDEEIARATEAHCARDRGKRLQMVTFIEGGKPLRSSWLEELKFAPIDDGMTVRVRADFVEETPPEMSYPKRMLGHADGPIRFRLIGGWHGGGEKIGTDTFRIKLDRFFFSRPWGSLMVMAYHPGDDRYAYAEQAVAIKFPPRNAEGAEQRITFPPIPDQTPGAPALRLRATSDSGLRVEYCVLYGPADIEDGELRLTAVPPGSALPVRVSVMAYQWGRSVAPRVKSAEPVERTFAVGVPGTPGARDKGKAR